MTTGTARPADIEIRTLSAAGELVEAGDLLQRVWGTSAPIVPLELLIAISHTGGYVAGAFADGTIVGASAGMLARHRAEWALHSHVTGLVAAARGTGLGRELKLHQRAWAVEHGLGWITWTFDPLVRRNAWFNIAILGATIEDYLPSFYGTMNDAINAGDESDRLLAAWDLNGSLPTEPREGSGVDDAEFVATPDDIVALRRTDPAAAARWRSVTRAALSAALDAGRPVVGFTRAGDYVIGSTP